MVLPKMRAERQKPAMAMKGKVSLLASNPQQQLEVTSMQAVQGITNKRYSARSDFL